MKIVDEFHGVVDTRIEQWDSLLEQYFKDIAPLSEIRRSHRFSVLLNELLDVKPEFIGDYVKGIEQSFKSKIAGQILRGRADNLFGNVIIEFKGGIVKERDDAEDQLRRYVAILWSNESPDARKPYICIATDGERFVSYSPTASDMLREQLTPDHIDLRPIEETNWHELTSSEIFYWLDRYFVRKELIPPTSEGIVNDFGINSHAFHFTTNTILELWKDVESHSNFQVVYDNWRKYLRIVYGNDVTSELLFVRHTYLATLSKVMSWMRISDSESLPKRDQIIRILEGSFFKDWGIENFLEEDFFSWIAHEQAAKVGVGAVRWLFSLLQNYDLHELSEDILKGLYQELVDPETRHDLGEFYTPDWLAHRIIKQLLDEKPDGMVLDPTCGSGTFLYLAIREKREWMPDSPTVLEHILDSVYGADIHPLAVIIAKTNYMLALGDLLKKRKRSIVIPVYLSDTIRLPELTVQHDLSMEIASYLVELDGQSLELPEPLLADLGLYDSAIELIKDFVNQNKNKPIESDTLLEFLKKRRFEKINDLIFAKTLLKIASVLKYFIDADRDTIWAFILKNIYKPLFFEKKFDFIVGNPPWIVLRTMEQFYQDFLKQQITKEYNLLKSNKGELITHLEIATLFFVRSADLYLKQGGKIGFVLTRSIFTSDHHDGLRRLSFKLVNDSEKYLQMLEVWDCKDVKPLFKVPSCILIAKKTQDGLDRTTQEIDLAERTYPIKTQVLSGKLLQKNASLDAAMKELKINDTKISLYARGEHSYWSTTEQQDVVAESFYKHKFFQGATIFPRSLWFVQLTPSAVGFNEYRPLVETPQDVIKSAKEPYCDLFMKQNIEEEFLYSTLLSTDLLPFGQLKYRLVVLPIKPERDKYKLIYQAEAHQDGFLDLEHWLANAESLWIQKRGSKAEKMTIYTRLDYMRGLTRQNPRADYRVVYCKSGTYLTAAVLGNSKLQVKTDCELINTRPFVVDSLTYSFETNNRKEAFYLAAVLNAPVIDELVKPAQSRGLWGPRDFHKKVLDFPILEFDKTDSNHMRLYELGEECTVRVNQWILSGAQGNITSIGHLRSKIRNLLKVELEEIDTIVKELLLADFEGKIFA